MSTMILLSGEQAAPNLLPARYFKPEKVYILHTDFWKSKQMAERLKLRMAEMSGEISGQGQEKIVSVTQKTLGKPIKGV